MSKTYCIGVFVGSSKPLPPKNVCFSELSILQFYIETLKGVKPICYSKKWKIRTVKIQIPPDYDAPQDLIVVVGTYGKIKGKVRYG